MGASACSTPRVAGRAESERRLSACESAYLSASSNSDRMNDTSTHIVERYLSARQASYDWIETATQCSARFGEGTMRGAQARHIVRTLATRLGIAVDPVTPSRLDDVSSLDLDDDSLSTMAEAEDAAGFATEILAARSDDNVSLDLSDRHKTTSQRLISLAGNDDDHRDKVYDAATLLANPDTMVDGATGLKAPTGAVIEMNVDGFRFDLAATLARQFQEVDKLSAFFDIVEQDPVISRVKLIAEPWDLGSGGYQVGGFRPAGRNGTDAIAIACVISGARSRPRCRNSPVD